MAIGAKAWDPATGALISEITTRMSRRIGEMYVAAGAVGSVTDAGFATGSPYCICVRTLLSPPNVPNSTMAAPIISFVGNTMFYDVAAPASDHLLIYGVR